VATVGVVELDGARWLVGRPRASAASGVLARLTLRSSDGERDVDPQLSDDGQWAIHDVTEEVDVTTVTLADGSAIVLHALDVRQTRPAGPAS
jgi:hypothetical protein